MIAYFYAATLGFDLVDKPLANIPAGSAEVSQQEYLALFEGQAAGKRISANAQGRPVLVDLPEAPIEVLESNERVWRDAQFDVTDGVVARHRDELEEGPATTLTGAQYAELQAYRRALRNWPQNGEFPLIDHRPAPPPWLEESTR